MSKQTNEIKEFLESFLDENNLYSTLIMALRSARKHTGANIFTGTPEKGLYTEEILGNSLYVSEYFTGITLYLILLEQIGILFCKKDKDIGGLENGIKVALKSFSSLSSNQINAILALRNTLAHNFGLATVKNKHRKQHYKFCLKYDDEIPVVTINQKWDGDYKDKSDDTITAIGVPQLCALIEDIFKNLKVELQKDNLELLIQDLDEIKARFTVR